MYVQKMYKKMIFPLYHHNNVQDLDAADLVEIVVDVVPVVVAADVVPVAALDLDLVTEAAELDLATGTVAGARTGAVSAAGDSATASLAAMTLVSC
jgi:hypothetical protein